jgi:hypothetical protein
LDWPHAKQVALIARERLLHDEVLSQHVPRVGALYLREADAEINWVTRSNL